MYHHIMHDFSLSKDDLMKLHYPSLYYNKLERHCFDYSIPQTWVDWVKIELPDVSMADLFMFVWYYEPESVMGEPLPLTEKSRQILVRLNELERLELESWKEIDREREE